MTQHGEMGSGKSGGKLGLRENMWRMMKKMAECTRSAVMLDGEISKCVDTLQGVAQGRMLYTTRSIQGIQQCHGSSSRSSKRRGRGQCRD